MLMLKRSPSDSVGRIVLLDSALKEHDCCSIAVGSRFDHTAIVDCFQEPSQPSDGDQVRNAWSLLKPTSSSLSLIGLRPTYLSLSLLSIYTHTLACWGHIEPSSFGFTVILLSHNFLSPRWYQSEKSLRVPSTPPPLASPAAPPPSAPAPPPSVFGLRFIVIASSSLSRRHRVVVAFFVAFVFFSVCALS